MMLINDRPHSSLLCLLFGLVIVAGCGGRKQASRVAAPPSTTTDGVAQDSVSPEETVAAKRPQRRVAAPPSTTTDGVAQDPVSPEEAVAANQPQRLLALLKAQGASVHQSLKDIEHWKKKCERVNPEQRRTRMATLRRLIDSGKLDTQPNRKRDYATEYAGWRTVEKTCQENTAIPSADGGLLGIDSCIPLNQLGGLIRDELTHLSSNAAVLTSAAAERLVTRIRRECFDPRRDVTKPTDGDAQGERPMTSEDQWKAVYEEEW